MIVKERKKPKELLLLELLSNRKMLSARDYKKYQNLSLGYEGELRFDAYTKKYGEKLIMLNDLLLRHNE